AATWGGSPAEVTTVAGTLRVPELPPAENVFTSKLVNHPVLELQQAAIGQRRAALELEQAQAVQDVTVGGGLRFLRDGSDAGFVAGVSVPLPVRNRNQGNIRAARENLAGAEQMVRAVEAALRAAFTAAWQDLLAAHTAMQSLHRDALPATEEAYTAVRSAYERGALPLIDVLDAQRALVAIRREILDAESAYAAAFARIEALTEPTFNSLTTLLSQP
ncbi:MAG: TolC family protein, partial [Opitutaceae bacterium]|nr:TolC family protein [Opitutaceae bacterium]